MTELFEIDFKRFLDEIQEENIMPGGRNKIEIEDRGEVYHLYLTPIGINKTYVTVVTKDEYIKFQHINIGPISKSSIRRIS